MVYHGRFRNTINSTTNKGLLFLWLQVRKTFIQTEGVRKDMSLFAVTKPIFGVSKADCWLTAYSSWCVRVDKQTTKLKLFTVVSFLVFSLSCKITFFTSAYKPIHMCHLTSQVQWTEHVRKSQYTIDVCDKDAAFQYKQLYLS